MRFNSFDWSAERLSSDALQPRFSPLQCFIPISGEDLIPEGCEKEREVMNMERVQKNSKGILNFISLANSSFRPFPCKKGVIRGRFSKHIEMSSKSQK